MWEQLTDMLRTQRRRNMTRPKGNDDLTPARTQWVRPRVHRFTLEPFWP